MNKTTCTEGVWTEVATGVTAFAFNLINDYPDTIQKKGYKIHWGASTPAVDTTDFNYYELDTDGAIYAYPIQFTNSTSTNVYVMSVFDDGAITY